MFNRGVTSGHLRHHREPNQIIATVTTDIEVIHILTQEMIVIVGAGVGAGAEAWVRMKAARGKIGKVSYKSKSHLWINKKFPQL